MPLIPYIGRKSLYYRSILGGIYFVLIALGLTMVLPFLFMLSRASSNRATVDRFELVPGYLMNSKILFTAFLAERYGTNPTASFQDWSVLYGFTKPGVNAWKDLIFAPPPLQSESEREKARRVFEDTNEFTLSLARDPEMTMFLHINTTFHRNVAAAAREFLFSLHGDKTEDQLSRLYGLGPRTMESMLPGRLIQESFIGRSVLPDSHPRVADYRAFKKYLAEREDPSLGVAFVVHFLDLQFQNFLRTRFGSFENIQNHWPSNADGLRAIRLPPEPPEDPKKREVWYEFVRTSCPIQFVRLGGNFEPAYKEYLSGVSEQTGQSAKTGPAPTAAPRENEAERATWTRFVENVAQPEWLTIITPATAYREFLEARYTDLDGVNRAYGTEFASWDVVRPPLDLYDAYYVENHSGKITWRLLTQNYEDMGRFLVTRGNAGINTVVLIFCVLLGSFIVNPLAAYALSRFRVPYGAMVLLFLLAVIAFPSEVQMIPDFLILKEFGLLNTYFAIILPGLASGFSIFLLRGFFESLPRELYEAAEIDGAGEFRMFLTITIPLSLPIIAYLAFGVFVGTYASWNWALLKCQDPTMWTISVELFQFQVADYNPEQLKYASFVIASIPTLVAFLLCQRVILRGIVIPQMK